jgi:hypothetical protein
MKTRCQGNDTCRFVPLKGEKDETREQYLEKRSLKRRKRSVLGTIPVKFRLTNN